MLKNATHTAELVLFLFIASGTILAQNSGADTFKAQCQVCHGVDGQGNTPVGKAMGVHPYNDPDVRKLSNANLAVIVKNGKNKMPAFGGKLTDAQIKDLLIYIHTLQK
jgi:mono/diheme cytochrome c family protein